MSATEEVAAVGETQRFECQVVGYPTPAITWYKDDVDITSDPRYNIGFDKDRGVITLTIYQVLPSDEGCYQCKAENSEGKATTTSYLVVRVDHGLSRGFQSMLVSERTSEQEVSQVQMASSDKQRVFEEIITRVEETEKEVIEEKLVPPKITYDRKLDDGVQLKSGATLYIEVGVTGIPQPEVTWHHNDTKLEESSHVTMETDKGWAYMKHTGSTVEESGSYRVSAENSVGKDEAAFNVKVKAPPSCPRNLRVTEVYKDFITIAWDEPESDGGDKIQAYNVEKSLGGGMFVSVAQVDASEKEMKVTRLYEGSEYLFRVTAMNKTGVSPPATLDKPVKARLPFDPPGTPRNLKVTEVNKDYAVLKWDAPESDGGALITQYIIEKKDTTRITGMWAIAGTVEGTQYQYKVDKLFTGNSYLFRVYAENRVGPGEPATTEDAVVAKLPYDQPKPPRNLRAVETSIDYIVIEWDEPESDGGSPITGYVIEKRDSKRREYIYITDVGADVRSYKATRLFEGYEYYFRVMAENIVGPSAPCELEKPVKAKLPYDEPEAPRNLQVKDYWTDYVTICWEAPENDGGSPLTGYVIEKRDANRATWVKAGNVGPDIDTFKVINLFEGTEYVFRVFAENKVGPSLKAAELDKPVKAKMPFDPPFAPQNLKVSDVNRDCCTLSWDAPANDGGAPIERYIIEQRDAMRSTWSRCGTTEATVFTHKVEDLIEGDSYFFRVVAENKVGRGEYNELTHPVKAKLPYDKPQAPTKLHTTEIWSDHITLAWTAPIDDGGSTIISYNVEVRDALTTGFKSVASVDAKNTSYKVTDLVEGHDYYFRVYAVNAAGSSHKSAELKPAVKAKLPYTAPNSPRNVKADSVTVDSITISWEAPDSDGGTKILGYIIEIQEEGGVWGQATTVDGLTLTVTIKDLKEGVTYNIQVFAENSQGRSKPEALSQPVKTKTAEKPAPKAEEAKPAPKAEEVKAAPKVEEVKAAPKAEEVKPVEEKPVEAKPAPETKAEEPAKAGPPSAPKSLRVTEAQPDAVTIMWEAPASDGGSPVTNYVVVFKDVDSSKKFRKAGRVDANTFILTITDKIKKGHEYLFVVYAENEHGVSADGAELATPIRIPDKRTVIAEEEKVTIEAVAPVAAAPEEKKPEEKKPEEKKPEEKKPEEKKPEEKKPEEKKPEPVEEEAVVEEAVSPVAQAPVEAAKPEKKAPSAPRHVKVSDITDESFTVTWDAPESDGGAEVTQYTIVMRDMEKKKFKPVGTADGKTHVFKVTKIKENHEYIVRIYAENEAGLSAEGELDKPVKAVSPTAAKDEPDAAPKGPAPEILSAPEPVAIKEGETIRLSAKVKGDPEPDVTWHRGDKEIKKTKRDPRIKTDWNIAEDIYTLTITDAKADDAGEYTVIAANEFGSFKYTVTVLVGIPEGARIVETTRKTTSVQETIVDGEVVERVEKEDTKVERMDEEIKEDVIQEEKLTEVKASKPDGSPKIEIPPEPVEVDVGETIKLTCKVTGTPEPTVKWFKDGHEVQPAIDTRVRIDTDAKEDLRVLIIENATRQDEGTYRLEITNENGSEGVNVIVNVDEKKPEPKEPKIECAPEPVEFTEGETITLKCQVSGYPVPDFTWYRDNEQISLTDTRVKIVWKESTSECILTIENATRCDEGAYKFNAVNDLGSVAVTVMVTVDLTGTPQIEIPPQPVTCFIGETITLSTRVTGDPDPDITWYKDQQLIKPRRTDKRIKTTWDMKDDLNVLTIKDATKADEGTYRMEAINERGTISANVVVNVDKVKKEKETPKPAAEDSAAKPPRPPTIEKVPEPVIVQEGDTIWLSCKIKGHNKAPDVRWVRCDRTIFPRRESIDRLKADWDDDVFSLRIRDVKRGDEGEYRVEASDEGGLAQASITVAIAEEEKGEDRESPDHEGKDATDSFQVSAEEHVILDSDPTGRPHISMDIDSLEIKEGESIRLTCTVSADQEAEVNWLKDDKKLKKKQKKDPRIKIDHDVKQDLYILEITEATVEDSGKYVVHATNAQGTVTHTVEVTVKAHVVEGKPKFGKLPEPVSVNEGEEIRITCEIFGSPQPNVDWFHGGQPIKSDTRVTITVAGDAFTLVIDDATLNDDGEYSITAVNSFGKIFHSIKVTVEAKVAEAGKPAGKAPEFVKKPGAINAQEFDPVEIRAVITGSPSVTWFKEGKPIKNDAVKSKTAGDVFTLTIPSASLLDAGEYTITANNDAGGTFHTVNVSIEAATEKEDTEKEEEDKDMALVEKLLPKITAEKEKLKEEDEMLFKEYPCLDDHKDNVRGVELKKGDIVEVLDTEKDDEWLVRKQAEKEKVCYVPVELLLGKKEKKGRLSRSPSKKEESSEEEELTDTAEAFPVFQAIADYNPPEDAKDHLTLKEGQFVEVLDQNNPERWLCRTKPTKNTAPKQGWVPPSYLEARRGSGQADTRTPREVFRDDVLQLDNKEQEAAMKRRYALTDLWESERDYIRDLQFAMDTYYAKFDGELPDSLKGKKDTIFSTFPKMRDFHADQFLADLLKCSSSANSVGQCFLDHTEDFQIYVPYYMGREQVDYILNLEEPQKFIKDHDKGVGNVGESKLSLTQYLSRPVERIDEYINILRDFMKYSSRAGDDVAKADAAIKMLLELRRKAEDDNALSRITGYPGDLSELGPILRHDDFLVWDTDPSGKGKERHLFLFDNKLMLTKKKKPKNAGDPTTYEFKGILDLPDIQMNEFLEDERRFELWFADAKTEKYTFQARNVHIKQAWCDDIRRCMRKLGYATADGDESDVSAYQSALEDEGTEPVFSAKLKPVNCTEGEPIRFTCQITGLPAPDITWFRDGKQIKASADFKFEMDGDKYMLFIPKASKDFAGKYSIKATNKNGTIESSAELTVELANMAPSFKSKLKDVETKLGSQARFEVKVAALPEAEVVWHHNGEEVKSGERFKFLFEDEETFVLIIENITIGDEGTYKIKATNSLGKKSCSANLTISDLEDKLKWKAPKFTSGLKDVSTVEGEKAKLSCKISGYPEPEIIWLKDGEVLKPDSAYKMTFVDGSASLTIKSITMEHAGKYTCRITNSSGTCDSSAKVLVDHKEPGKSKAKPKFTKKIADVDILKGEKAEFKVEVGGLPLPEVTWFHKQKALVETDRIKIYKFEGEYTLVLSSTLKKDAGEYTCKATNESGEVSCSAQLYVTEDTLKESDDMEMSYAPSFTKKISNQEVLLGTLAQFHCKCIGVPDPDVSWTKDGKPIEANDHVIIDRDQNLFSLLIHNTELEDAGTYECIIINTAGTNKCSAELIIEKPKPKEPLRSSVERSTDKDIKPPIMPTDKPYLTNIDVNNFNLSWLPAILPPKAKPTPIFYSLERCPLPGSEWVTIATDLTDTTTHVSDFDPLKDYMYRAKAFNAAGESDPTNTLSVLARHLDPSLVKKEPVKDKLAPRPVRDKPVIFDVTHDSLKLSWQPSEIPSYGIQTAITYVVERRCPPSKNWIEVAMEVKDTTWTMIDYKPQKDYMFRIRAQNEYGISDPSMSATLFSTPVEEEKPKKAPAEEQKSKCKPRTVWDKPELFDITDTTCKLRWKPSSLPNYAEQTPIVYIVEKREPPNTDWNRIVTDVEDLTYEVRKISRKRDYYFRIRASNQYGTSEPSMPVMLRKVEEVDVNLELEKKKKKQKSEEDYIPTKRVPLHMRVIPEFLGQTDEIQYGVDGRTAKIVTYMRAYPEPTIMWFFNGEKITFGEKYTSTLSAQGELVLEIDRFSWSDVGDYKIYIENEFGSASLIIKMDMADPPTFLSPMIDQVFNLRMDGKLECRVHGIPYPTVQFKHDWRVIADGHRVKISREDYDHWTLNVRNAIYMDEGNYECVAENIAGKVYCTAAVKVNEKAGLRDIRFNPVPLEDYFHIIDELGRGAYGVVRRVIDKNSGNQYAAKFLRFPDHLVKSELETELEMLTLMDHTGITQIIDGYEDKKRLVIVMEIVTGGELLSRLVKNDALTESEVAFYIRQLLLIVEHMHCKSVVHLDLKPENMCLASRGSDELKLIDFGFARRYNPRLGLRVKYATPEYCAPEVAKNEDITPAADMWSVGVITYILLSGISPFHKDSARDTLLKVKSGEWEFDKEAFANISKDAKDFITKCLTVNPKKRVTATAAIDHSFIELAHHRGLGDRINLEKIRGYMFRRKWERGLQSVKTFAQPKPLSAYMSEMPVFEAPTLEVEVDVPILDLPGAPSQSALTLGAIGGAAAAGPASDTGSAGSCASLTVEAGAAGMLQVMGPPSLLSGAPSTIGSGGSSEWGREYEDEDTWYEWSSSYQTGPETFLLPKSDSGLSMRMAKYRRSGGRKSSGAGGEVKSARPSMRERRDLRELEKEAAMAEDSLVRHTGKKSVWQLKAMIDNAGVMEVFPPIFKEKIRDKAYNVGDSCTLHIHVIGNPMPAVSWYRNDELLTEGGRVRTSQSEDGRHSLTVLSTKPNDFGVYKCVARNKHGKVTCRARMHLGDCPGRPGRPHVTKVSEKEIYMLWEEPETDGNSYILAYRVDWHRPGDERWTTATYCIDECALVKGLQSDTTYRFRIAAINRFGVSPYSWASVEIRTRSKGSGSIDIDDETKRILLRSRQAQSRPSPDPSPVASPAGSMEDLSKLADDKDPGFLEREVFLQEKTDPHKYLNFGSEVWRGRYTLVRNVKPKELGKKAKRIAKIIPYDSMNPEESLREYEMLKNVRQEHIVRLYEAFQNEVAVVLIFEKLFGENVARSLSLKNRYSEHAVTGIIKQVLDGLQFLHHRGIVHLNLQPDNVIMVSRRRFDIKLIDFGRARKITTYDGEKVDRYGTAEFMAPEKVAKENVGVPADIWGVGVLAFILLSGVSPFHGETDEDVFANIKSVRYDAHQIYHNVTKYALKFIYQSLKRNAKSRLTTEECLDHKWLMLNSQMIKMRKAAIFPTERLRLFEEDYIHRRMAGGGPSGALMSVYGKQDVFSDSEDEAIGGTD